MVSRGFVFVNLKMQVTRKCLYILPAAMLMDRPERLDI